MMPLEPNATTAMRLWRLMAMVASFLLLGCAPSQVESPVLPTSKGGDRGGDDALLDGLIESRDGCVGIREQDTGEWLIAIWPADTRVVEDDGAAWAVDSPEFPEVIPVGGEVAAGGGYHDRSDLEDDVVIPDACAAEGYWVMNERQ